MEDWLHKHCGAMITATPDQRIEFPEGVEWHRFRNICVNVDYPKRSRASSAEDFVGMRQLIDTLLAGQPERLPDFAICFQEDGNLHRDEPYVWGRDNVYDGTGWYEQSTRKPRGRRNDESEIFPLQRRQRLGL